MTLRLPTLLAAALSCVAGVGCASSGGDVGAPSTTVRETTTTTEASTTTSSTTTTTTLPPRVTELQLDDLPLGPAERLPGSQAKFVQRVVGAITDRSIVVDGIWGAQSAGALADADLLIGGDGSEALSSSWWEAALLWLTDAELDAVVSNVAADLALPDGAVLWRDRVDDTDPLFSSEEQFIVAGGRDADALAQEFAAANPSFDDIDLDAWPSWVVAPGDAGDAVQGYYDSISVGDCFDFPTASQRSARRVPCSFPHDGQMHFDSTVPRWMRDLGRYPTQDEVFRLYDEECVTRADAYRSDWLDADVNLFMDILLTVESDWGANPGFSCVWTTYDGSLLLEFVESDLGADTPVGDLTERLAASLTDGDVVVGFIDRGPGRVDIAIGRLAEGSPEIAD